MSCSEESFLYSTMTHSKNEMLEHIKEKKIYFPPYLESKLLKWNCFPLINFNTGEIEVNFGVFFFQILQLSQNQKVKQVFQEWLKHKLKDLQKDQFIYICQQIFQKQSLNPFPQSFEFKPIGDYFQESFIYEKHIPDKQPSYYKCLNGAQVQDVNEQDLKYRILLYVSGEEQGNQTHIIFSTNNDVKTLFSIPDQSVQQFIHKNQISFPQPLQHPQQFSQKQFVQKPFQTNYQQASNCQEEKEQNISHQNLQPKQQQFASNISFSQMINPQQQNQIIQQQWKFQTHNNSNPDVSKVKFIPKPNEGFSQSTGAIQLANKFKGKFQTQIQISKSEEPTSMQSSSIQQKTEEINVFSTQQINEMQQDDAISKLPTQCRILTNYTKQKQQDIKECEICTMDYNLDSDEAIMTPCCKLKVHANCFQQHLNQKAKECMNFEQITCYCCQQSLKNDQDFIKNTISNTLFGELVKRKVLSDIPMRCCKCQLAIKASEEILNKQVKLQCLQCSTQLCSLCRQEYHGDNQQNQSCPSLLKEIQKAFQNMPTLVCPFCQLFQTKDDNCNHVNCSGCKRDLCSACSVDRIPILAHGNHYHREGCPDYKPWEVKGKIIKDKEFNEKKCSKCKETKKACEYPMSLQEYRKSKQF